MGEVSQIWRSGVIHDAEISSRTYYARSRESISELRPQTGPSTSEVSLGVSRPRTRPREGDERRGDRESMAIEPAEPTEPLQPSGATLVEVQGQPRRKVSQIWSPHLWHDRRAVGRRSLFQPPSLDEQAEGHPMSRRTAQIILFAVGFVFPIGKSGLHRFPFGNSNMNKPGLSLPSYLYRLARYTMKKTLPCVLAV